MAEPKLPPLQFDKEIELYSAFEEKKEVEFKKCPHSKTQIKEGALRCQCGVAYYGNVNQLIELQKLLSR